MASNDLERLVVQLSADITRYERALNRANGVANSRTRQIENRFKRMQTTINGSFAGISSGATRAFAVIGGAAGVKALSDAGTSIDNALKTAGQSGEELERTYAALRSAALANGAPIQSLVQLYGRLSIVQGELGVNSQQIESFSKNVAVALRAGGQSAAEASGALLQLTQALGGGIVRAEEFNSIQEGAPTILQAAARGIDQAGGSVAKLRKIMLDGQLSSKALFDGFQAGSYVLEDRVQNSVFTLSQRFENLNTVLIDAVRRFNNSTGAANTLGAEIDRTAQYVQQLNFENLISELGKVVSAFNTAATSVQGFFTEAGKLSGLSSVGATIRNIFGDENGEISFLGGALTIKGADGNDDLSSRRRREIEGLIAQEAELQRKFELAQRGTKGNATANYYQKQIEDVQAARRKLADEITNLQVPLNPLQGQVNVPAAQAERPAQVDITDSRYRVKDDDAKAKKARKERLDDYQKEVTRIRERTDATNSETEAQSKLNPLVNDYGYALAKARAEQDLTNAAIEAGRQVTPELANEIAKLADAYAMSEVAAERLAESQDKIKERQAEILAVQKDVTRGFVDDLLAGKDAAEIFNNALKKIASTLLDSAFTSFFNPTSSGGIGGFGGLFNLLGFARGGYTGAGGQYEPAGVVHKGEYVVPKSVVDKVGVKNIERAFGGYANGGLVNSGLSRSRSSSSVPSAGSGVNAVYSPTIDARGASVDAVARLERIIETDRRNFSARVESAVVKARKSNKAGF